MLSVICCISRHAIGDVFARNAGYNEVGQLNNIIILYPQAIAVATNPLGCWDWWGYTVNSYGRWSSTASHFASNIQCLFSFSNPIFVILQQWKVLYYLSNVRVVLDFSDERSKSASSRLQNDGEDIIACSLQLS